MFNSELDADNIITVTEADLRKNRSKLWKKLWRITGSFA